MVNAFFVSLFAVLENAADAIIKQCSLVSLTSPISTFSSSDPGEHLSRLRFATLMFLCGFIPFYSLCIFYKLLENVICSQEQLKRWRFQKTDFPDAALATRAKYFNFFYQICGFFLAFYVGYPLFFRRNPDFHSTSGSAMPQTLTEFFLQIALCYVSTDFTFYWAHRTLHHPLIYNHIHKQHHMFKITTVDATTYAHPVEWFFGNVLPVLSGPWIFKLHAIVILIWMFVAIAGTTMAHSGWWFPTLDDNILCNWLWRRRRRGSGGGGGGGGHHDSVLPSSSKNNTNNGKKKNNNKNNKMKQFQEEEEDNNNDNYNVAPSEWHDFHHSHNVGNFGHSPLFDSIFGTRQCWDKYLVGGVEADADAGGSDDDEVLSMASGGSTVSMEEMSRIEALVRVKNKNRRRVK